MIGNSLPSIAAARPGEGNPKCESADVHVLGKRTYLHSEAGVLTCGTGLHQQAVLRERPSVWLLHA